MRCAGSGKRRKATVQRIMANDGRKARSAKRRKRSERPVRTPAEIAANERPLSMRRLKARMSNEANAMNIAIAMRAPAGGDENEQDRPEQIKLLFDGHAPKMKEIP
mgnify:CR=1 FL=1